MLFLKPQGVIAKGDGSLEAGKGGDIKPDIAKSQTYRDCCRKESSAGGKL